MDKICKIFEVDLNYFIDESKYRQVNKPNSTGYLAETQNIQLSDKVIEQLNNLIKDKDLVILELKEIIQQQNEIIKKLNK
jgi:hypothetical protein